MVIGASGYIGSRLCQFLQQYHRVTTVDIGWVNDHPVDIKADYNSLTEKDLEGIQVVVLLAGHSSVKSCDGKIQGPWLNNVTNFNNLLAKLNGIPLIYASSASVYGNNTPGKLHTETDTAQFRPVNNYDITKYVLDLHAQRAIDHYKNVIGLRFGTVNGWSPVLRADVMINAMVRSALDTGMINITNAHISRAILGINDLCEAVLRCINDTYPGIYNLSSFNLTVAEIAAEVACALRADIINHGVTENAYDFGLDCTKFKETFKYEFQDTPATIVRTLVEKYQQTEIGTRNEYKEYNEKR